MPYTENEMLCLARCGDVVVVFGNVKFAYSGQNNYTRLPETIPEGFRPRRAGAPITCGNVDFSLLVSENGTIDCAAPASWMESTHDCTASRVISAISMLKNAGDGLDGRHLPVLSFG